MRAGARSTDTSELLKLRRELSIIVDQIEVTMLREGVDAIMPVKASMLLSHMLTFADLVDEKLSEEH